jgi:hypothetical protein
LFPSGIPSSIAFDVLGKEVYDPRTSTTGYSNNPALCARDFITDTEFGLGADPATIDDDTVTAAANICEETVNLKAGGTQQRYTCDGTFDASVARGDALNAMLTAMAGWVNPPGDAWKIFAGAYTDPVLSLSDSDFRGPIKYDTRVSRRNLANAVTGTFTGPENNWQPTDFPPYESATFLSEDGSDYIPTDITLDFTTNHIRCQRLAKIHLEQNRRQNQLVLPCSLAAFPCEPGDVIEVSHSRFGWTNKTFLVTNTSLEATQNADQVIIGTNLTCVPIDTDVYAWDETTDEGAFTGPASTTLPNIGTVGAPSGLALSNVEVTRADGIKALQIKATWTPPADTHVLNGGKIEIWMRERDQNFTIPATSIPWSTLGINASFVWNWDNIGTDPIAIPIEAGESITIEYVSGSGLYSAAGTASDLDGDEGGESGVTRPFPEDFASDGPDIGVLGLIGTFADELGNIIAGGVHNIGNGPRTLTAPSGAKQILLGLNDTFFGPGSGVPPDGPNTGSFIVKVQGGQSNWRLVGQANGADTVFYIPGVVDAVHYDVRVIAVNSYGASSAADEVDDFTATATSATFTGSLDSITRASDVVVTSPATNDVLKWNGSEWVNGPPTAGGSFATTDFSADGSSLSGWTLGAATPLVKTSSSNPRLSPSAIFCPVDASSHGRAFKDPAVALAGKTIEFDILVLDNTSIGYLIFGITSTGTGQGIFMDFRGIVSGTPNPGGVLAHFTAFAADAYVDTDSNDPMLLDKLTRQWINVRAVIDATAATVTIFVNGQMWHKAPLASFAGTGIAIGGGSVGTGAYFRNILIGH